MPERLDERILGHGQVPVRVKIRLDERYGCIGQFEDPEAAVDDFIRAIETRILPWLQDDDDRVLTLVLDGENAWGGYADDGRPFLRALYHRLTHDPRFRTVTFSEYLEGHPERGVRAHRIEGLTRVHELATGSWIDEPGSAPGVDLGTWIGEAEENAAWLLVADAHTALTKKSGNGAARERAQQSLYAAEGSDWFWWFGTDQESRNDAAFDELFRGHLRGVYQALGVPAPDALDDPIVAHPVVWTFTRPVHRIGTRDRLTIRTNCPGRLTYHHDGGSEKSEMMIPVGGVMAGARQFQLTLGSFPAASQRLEFRFQCEHAGCRHDAPCCAGASQDVHFTAQGQSGHQDRSTDVRGASS